MNDELDRMARAQENIKENDYRNAIRNLGGVDYESMDENGREHYDRVLKDLWNGLVTESQQMEDTGYHGFANQFGIISEALELKQETPDELEEIREEVAEEAYRKGMEMVETNLDQGEHYSFTNAWRDLEKAQKYAQAAKLGQQEINRKRRTVAEEGKDIVLKSVYDRLEILSEMDQVQFEDLQDGPTKPGELEDLPRELVHSSLNDLQTVEEYIQELGLDDIEAVDVFEQDRSRELIDESSETMIELVGQFPGHISETVTELKEIAEKFGYFTELNQIVKERAEEMEPLRRRLNNAEASIQRAREQERSDRGFEEVDSPEEVDIVRFNSGPNAAMESARRNLDEAEEMLDIATPEITEEYIELRQKLDEEFRNPK